MREKAGGGLSEVSYASGGTGAGDRAVRGVGGAEGGERREDPTGVRERGKGGSSRR